MRVWLTKAPPGTQENVAWIELPDGSMLRLTEDGRYGVDSFAGGRIVKRMLDENANWERIS